MPKSHGPRWDAQPVGNRPESGLLALRQELGLYVNVRPVRLHQPLRAISPLKHDRLGGLDIEIVRELAGGMYFGERGSQQISGGERAFDTESYSTPEVERIAAFAYARAENRSRRLTSVDKANVLISSQLWRRTVTSMSQLYPSVRLEHLYVDNAAMQLVLRPEQFDVILTSNMFGDILSDEAAALVGSIGLLPSASFGTGTPLFEPIHGSAPQLAGKEAANPIGAILSVAMMLRDTFGLGIEADWIERSLERVLAAGYRTRRRHITLRRNPSAGDAAHPRTRRPLRLGRITGVGLLGGVGGSSGSLPDRSPPMLSGCAARLAGSCAECYLFHFLKDRTPVPVEVTIPSTTSGRSRSKLRLFQ